MKKQWISFLFLLAGSSAFASDSAVGKNTGIGFILGDPTGISLQLNANSPHPINLGVAYDFDHWVQFWGDYTFHFPHFVSSVIQQKTTVDAYIGIGGALVLLDSKHYSDSAGVLARVPFGLEYKLSTAPIGFMLELVPSFLIIPKTDFTFQGGIGARYYF